VLRRLCVNSGLSSLATVHGSLSAFAYPLFFHILADSFALTQNSTLLFSSNSKLFAQNTRGGVYIPVALVSHWPELANRPGRLSSNASFSTFNGRLSTSSMPFFSCQPHLLFWKAKNERQPFMATTKRHTKEETH